MFKNMQNMQAKIDEVTENLVKSIYDAKVKQLNMTKETASNFDKINNEIACDEDT